MNHTKDGTKNTQTLEGLFANLPVDKQGRKVFYWDELKLSGAGTIELPKPHPALFIPGLLRPHVTKKKKIKNT